MSAAKKLKPEFSVVDDSFKTDSSADKLAGYFYKIGNHEELYKIGRGLLQEAKKGVKNFAFTSVGHNLSQQRTILGLCCFFDKNTTSKVAIISDQFSSSIFKDMVDSSSLNSYSIGNGEDIVKFKSFHHHFDFIDYSELIKFYENHLYTKSFDIEMEKILNKYDIILWDVPEMEKLKEKSHFHFRVSHFYQSLTVIVSRSTSSGKQLESIKNYFKNYNINLNGVLFETADPEVQPKRRKVLGIF